MMVTKKKLRVIGHCLGLLLCVTVLLTSSAAQINSSSPLVLQPASDEVGFGSGLAVGDVNGDGIPDVIVGSVLTTVGGFRNAGRVFGFFGGSSLKMAPDLVLEAPEPEAEARFGWAVAVGDVNGDGFGDIIVSALFANGGARNGRGEVYVFLGGPGIDAQADVTLVSPPGLESLARFGWALGAGDINGDRIDDVLVGAENVTVMGAQEAGQVYVYLGSRAFTGALSLTLQSPIAERASSFGHTVAVADFNGDGFEDGAIGAQGQSVGGTANAGQVYIFFGRPSFDATADLALHQATPTTEAHFGISLATGDVNRDGRQDLIVGATRPPRSRANANQGEIHVFFGGNPMSAMAGFEFQQPSVTGLGQALGAGDVNRDGSSDIIAGVPSTDAGGAASAGKVLIFYGGPGLDGLDDIQLQSPDPVRNELFGTTVAAGDFNGDGKIDVIVGAIYKSVVPPSGPGKVFVFLGQ